MTSADKFRDTLKKIGFNEKEVSTYLALLSLGSSSVRKIAEKAGLNRGVTYEALKSLQKEGVVSFFHQDKHQHFVAENPTTLLSLLTRKQKEIDSVKEETEEMLPFLESFSNSLKLKPVVKFYENFSGIRAILEDVIATVSKQKDKSYVAYSSSEIRPFLYHRLAFPKFNDERIKKKIFVKTIAIGEGGTTHGKDERRWLSHKAHTPTYILIYAGKVAMISVGKNGVPHGTITEDASLFETELLIFESLWNTLK